MGEAMPDINPLPECLSHLAQRDKWVRDRTIEYAILVCEGTSTLGLYSRQEAIDECVKRLRGLLPLEKSGLLVE